MEKGVKIFVYIKSCNFHEEGSSCGVVDTVFVSSIYFLLTNRGSFFYNYKIQNTTLYIYFRQVYRHTVSVTYKDLGGVSLTFFKENDEQVIQTFVTGNIFCQLAFGWFQTINLFVNMI
jgi:hypothetical protein